MRTCWPRELNAARASAPCGPADPPCSPWSDCIVRCPAGCQIRIADRLDHGPSRLVVEELGRRLVARRAGRIVRIELLAGPPLDDRRPCRSGIGCRRRSDWSRNWNHRRLRRTRLDLDRSGIERVLRLVVIAVTPSGNRRSMPEGRRRPAARRAVEHIGVLPQRCRRPGIAFLTYCVAVAEQARRPPRSCGR